MDKYGVLKEIFNVEGISQRIYLCSKINEELLLLVLSKQKYVLNTALNIDTITASKYIRILWPEKPSTSTKVDGWLLRKYGYKECKMCLEVKEEEDFFSNSSKPDGLNTYCKKCYLNSTREYQREYQRRRKAIKLSRTPSWANISKIQEIYKNCPKGCHVDHIVPLQGSLVSGLHVENNLQYLLAEDNLKKHNKYIGE